jgi:hypothetical protein
VAQDVIERLGHTGNVVEDAHTLRWLRGDEHFLGQLFNRDGAGPGVPTMFERAHRRVQETLAAPWSSPVAPDALQRIEAYVAAQP